VEEAAEKLTREGASAVGANCGTLAPLETAAVISTMRECTELPLIAQPNAGKPRLESGRTVFDMEPDRFAAGVVECVRRGARLVGGCCGTRPEHIAALSAALKGSG
jgi:5-methyltetrahydrofolate--homocysteine methyltransferase